MSKLKEQILILRSDNKSYNEIAKILGCSKSIVGYFVMYSDRLKRRYYQGKRWAEAGPYTA